MRRQMLSRWRKIVGIFVLAIIGWGLLVYALDLPIEEHTLKLCQICRASKSLDTCFMIPVSIRVQDNEFSQYYKRYSDPKHSHVWCRVSGHLRSRMRIRYADGDLNPPYRMAWGILQALPRGEAQKYFFEKAANCDSYSAEDQKFAEALMKLKTAYLQNTRRKDWPAQLRKVGLYPKTDPKN